MEIIDFIIAAIIIALVLYLVWFKIRSKPEDKYYNDSWKKK